jgi:putative SOS response-associated peptidase YedK
MCGRFIVIQVGTLGLRFSAVARFQSETRPDLKKLLENSRYNVAPTQQVLAVVQESGERLLVPMRWGLIPSWAKPGQQLPLNINARDESVATSGMWRGPLRRSRCLIPAEGFFEWSGPRNNRVPHLIRLKSREPFAFAGLFDRSRDPESGANVLSCAIITTSANPLVRGIHDRMPVILPRDAEAMWLDPDVSDPDVLLSLLKPYPDGEMELFPVGTAVNNARVDMPELISPA